jgi:rsbT co-antagonist protein RsbR
MSDNDKTNLSLEAENAALKQEIAQLRQQLARQETADEGGPHAAETDAQMFKLLIDNAPDGVAVSTMDGIVQYVNVRYQVIHGYDGYEDDMIGSTITDVIPDPAELEPAMQVLREQGFWQGRIVHQRRDGSRFPVLASVFVIRNESGRPQWLAAIDRDISAVVDQEEQLRLARITLENTADVIGWYDMRGKLVYLNAAGFTLYGYTPEDLPNLHVSDIDPAFTADVIEHMAARLRSEGAFLVEREHRHRDGHMIPVEATNSYVAFDNREYICVVIRDVTERKKAATEQVALQQQIINAQQDALREISTPLIPISDEIVIMPLVGTIDSLRAQQIMETLLEGIAHYQSELAILDITGVSMVDTQVAQALVRAAQAVKLLGARVILTGIKPQIAQTLIHLGVDLQDIVTYGSFQSGVAAALAQRETLW